jgi:serine/threonine-protein kinase RsbW
MADELTLQVKNTFAAVHTANETASRWLEERRAAAEVQYFANLAIEELATNCIKYGYDDANEHLIEVRLSLSSDSLLMTVTDDGHAFNPLALPRPDTGLRLEDRPIGGLGIHLLREMADKMEYVRRGGKNRVTLRKKAGG